MGLLAIIGGCIAILGGIFGKNFYPADPETGAAYKQKRSVWSGRFVCITAGVFLIAVGIGLMVQSP
jgi:hypothetical protein